METKIVELQIAISNAKTDKAKAEARLNRLREGGIAVDEYIDAYVMERQRQQEAAEAQRRRDAERAAAEAGDSGGNEEEPRENYEMQQVHIISKDFAQNVLFTDYLLKYVHLYIICNRYNSQKLGIQQEAGMTRELEVGTMNRPPLPLQFNSNLNPPPPIIGQVGVTLPHLRPLAPKTIGQPSRKRPKMNPLKLLNNPSPTNNLRPKLTPNQFLQKVLNKQLFFTILMLRIRTS